MKPLLLGDEFKFTKRDHLSSDNHLVPLPLRTDLLIRAITVLFASLTSRKSVPTGEDEHRNSEPEGFVGPAHGCLLHGLLDNLDY